MPGSSASPQFMLSAFEVRKIKYKLPHFRRSQHIYDSQQRRELGL